MTGLDTRRYEMLLRVREFGMTYADLFPQSSKGGQAFAALAAAIDALTAHEAALRSGRGSERGTLTSRAVAYEALREDLDDIVRTATAIELDAPGVVDKFKPPSGRGVQELLNTARAYLRDATPLAAQFIEHDMSEDFLTDLRDDIEQLEAIVREQDTGRRVRVAADLGFDEAMVAALKAVRRLDACVPNKLRTDNPARGVWENARRIEYPPRRRRGTAADNTPTNTASTTARAADGAAEV